MSTQLLRHTILGMAPYTGLIVFLGMVLLSFLLSDRFFREVDNIIEPDFEETTPDKADIVIISSLDDLEDGAGGYFSISRSVSAAVVSDQQKIGYLTWRDKTGLGYLDEWEMHVIVHELGHALRLSHPGANGLGGSSGG